MVRLTRCFSRRRWNVVLLLALSAILILRLLHQRSEKRLLKSQGLKGPDFPDQNNTSWAERKIDSFKTIMSAFQDDQSSEEEDDILETTPPSNETNEEEEESDFFGDEWMGMLDNVLVGGRWAPDAKAGGSSEKIAIVVPYRSRRDHLKMFLFYMHPFLQRQGRHYGIYVVGQRGVEHRFCKGILYNMGFISVLKDDSYDCIIFHDVDLIPEDYRNEYTCGDTPRHLSVAVDTFNYTLPHEKIFGGVVAMTPAQYRLLNGYSNRFCGWGGEDDDMYNRLVKHKLQVSRPEKDVGRYTMFEHRGTPENKNRFSLLETSDLRANKDGLNSVGKTRAKITSMSRQPLFTHIVVSVAKQRRWKH
ncbi:PREDICTED: beta-1,4-galactosyltransferase 2-like [Branchiostoma belcheri]|uniref:Beta-1,4-galactosyltransferase n=1 Tax=Branchiostoma belcheri TaxID=7741 RepID=A0A6P4YP81_BRABE|nr:PREDICTED: beta-1,4-galactosyltransferase 2-like [Branchiostoma belcheri]XP_019619002.1 PREDICTED: beta-1,4-galactosyltransferase 2-like [Branchiostoma belcheri]